MHARLLEGLVWFYIVLDNPLLCHLCTVYIYMRMNAVHMCVYIQWKESGTIYIYQAALAARGGEAIWSAVSRCVRKCMVVEMFGSAWCKSADYGFACY